VQPAALARAAEIIATHRLQGLPLGTLPEDCRPQGEDEGYAVQAAVHLRLEAAGLGALAGHKVGLTNKVMQQLIGIDHPLAGGIMANQVFRETASFRHKDFVRPGAETELCVRLARDLPPSAAPFDRATVAAAVEGVMAAIEIVDDRYQDYRALGTPTVVADDVFNAGCVLGPVLRPLAEIDLEAVASETAVNGRPVGQGHGRDLLGHPLDVLVWLADQRAREGTGLRAGQIALLGSMVAVQWASPGDAVEIAVEGLGEVRCAFL
jgi:2-keto-4-pentenoate hydratase